MPAGYYWNGSVSGDIGNMSNYTYSAFMPIGFSLIFAVTGSNAPSTGTLASTLIGSGIAVQIPIDGGDFSTAIAVTLNTAGAEINGGTYSGTVSIEQGAVNGGDFYNIALTCGATINDGVFHSGTIANSGSILDGTFNDCVVTNDGSIQGGLFSEDSNVINNAELVDGTYEGKLTNNGVKCNGTFTNLKVITTFLGSVKFSIYKGLKDSRILGMI